MHVTHDCLVNGEDFINRAMNILIDQLLNVGMDE